MGEGGAGEAMVASTLAYLNQALKSLVAELRELNQHLDQLEQVVAESQARLRADGVERMKQAREMFPQGKKPEGSGVRFPDLPDTRKEAA